MKKLIINILLFVGAYSASAQNEYEQVLQQIETNSATLNALRLEAEAKKANNRTGIYLSNPEIEFNYLWGEPAETGNRKDISIKQSFDFPAVYASKNKISKLENSNVELEYRSERINLLLSARQVCIQLIYYKILAKEYEVRLQNAKDIAAAYRIKLDKGETNAIENNKAQLYLNSIENEIKNIETEQNSLLSELVRLNGGKEILFSVDNFSDKQLPANFEQWYAKAEEKNPLLQYVKGQIAISQQQIRLNKSLALPKFTAGYMREQVAGQRYEGVSLGISIPLRENKNRVKQAKIQLKASTATFEDRRIQFYGLLQNLYDKAVDLQQILQKYQTSLSEYSNERLLKKALDAGEISLLNYLLESQYYYELFNKMLETERDYELTVAKLHALEQDRN
ncbi:MAG: TolC family protein [Prevotellaceae bacterium]|jgi:outer membrane protein TolC|nr:TolC family protein [Prevotellaceae bacterium]